MSTSSHRITTAAAFYSFIFQSTRSGNFQSIPCSDAQSQGSTLEGPQNYSHWRHSCRQMAENGTSIRQVIFFAHFPASKCHKDALSY